MEDQKNSLFNTLKQLFQTQLRLLEGLLKDGEDIRADYIRADEIIQEMIQACDALSRSFRIDKQIQIVNKPQNEAYKNEIYPLLKKAHRHLNLIEDWVHIYDKKKGQNEFQKLSEIINELESSL
jgi:hypothetical protein